VALGDGIRRNIAFVDPSERALLRDAFIELNRRFFPGNRPTQYRAVSVGGLSRTKSTKQRTSMVVQSFFRGIARFAIDWKRCFGKSIRHFLYTIGWTQDPRAIPNANLGNGTTGTLNLFTPGLMGLGVPTSTPIGPPWQNTSAPLATRWILCSGCESRP
jgi:hypothetical protein